MSLWWARREQLDDYQIKLIEKLPLRESFLILGPPGSGKTNVLLRRAQFVRGQEMPNVLALTFTRPLVEFVRTGCYDAENRQLFPESCVTTLESWIRWLYKRHKASLPDYPGNLNGWKRQLATEALDFKQMKRIPAYDALFVDEAQDLVAEEVQLISQWSPVLFFVGDDRQKIFENTEGLAAVREFIPKDHERELPFHYRVAPEICEVADRILTPSSGKTLTSTNHYNGPTPASVTISRKSLTREKQLATAAEKLKQQARVYADFIKQGDRLGVIVPRKLDRDTAMEYFENDPELEGKCKIIRARDGSDDEYEPSIDASHPICILTIQGCKGLEFRALHWLFADDLDHHRTPEHYYTVITRAKTSLDVYYTNRLPETLARAHAESGAKMW